MQDSSWRRSAVTFVAVVIILAIILFGGLYALKHRHDNSDHKTPGTSTSKDDSKKTSKNNKESSKSENKNKNTKSNTNSSSNSSSNQDSSQSPGEVAAAGPSDYWYVPILGLAALAFGGYEYYLSRQALKRSLSNR
jgi:hypothetical protein